MRSLAIPLLLCLALPLAFVPSASAAVDVNRVTLLFHDLSSATLETEILYTNDEAQATRRSLDSDANGVLTQAELDAFRATLTSAPSDPIVRVLLDGAAPRDGLRATDVSFRDAGEDASSRDAMMVTTRYEATWPAPAGDGRVITLDSGERVVMAVHMEAPDHSAFTDSAGMLSGSGIREEGGVLSGLLRLGEPFRATLGPAPGRVTSVDATEEELSGESSAPSSGVVAERGDAAATAGGATEAPEAGSAGSGAETAATPGVGLAAVVGAFAVVALLSRKGQAK